MPLGDSDDNGFHHCSRHGTRLTAQEIKLCRTRNDVRHVPVVDDPAPVNTRLGEPFFHKVLDKVFLG